MPFPRRSSDAPHRRAARALERQRDYQRGVARQLLGHEREQEQNIRERALAAHASIAEVAAVPAGAVVVEVGSGGRGVIHQFPTSGIRVAVDPLAIEYRADFPRWTRHAQGCAAFGEQLPFRSGAFDVVICDNVVDHAESPARIVAELVRVLKPGGILYFTVNVHHGIYRYAALLHALWSGFGTRFELAPFADHTFHFTIGDVRALVRSAQVTVLRERDGRDAARALARATPPRHLGDRLKRLFFKNARHVVIARKPPAA